ncbi:MAG TPA: glycoside hydrolase family 3 C-terminal domain-containing protein, partial [Myxococcota bacterium]|nr:glycoside hydrolase family 3 C-terminal domain-containing protein [Myxococcota bacterium]
LEGMVLLQNGGALPLAAGARVAVVGALADVANTGDHGSSDVPYEGVVTPLAGLAARLDVTPVLTDTPDADQLAAIGAADAAIVVVGLTWEDEGEGIVPSGPTDRADLALPGAELIRAVATSQPRTIVVLEGSGPMWVEDVVDRVDALVMAWYPGQEGGRALADLLLGDADFTGRLPVVWPAAEDQLPPFDGASLQVTYGPLHGWRWMEAQGETPRFPFGFGLSYAACSVDEADVEGWPAATITGRAPGCPVVFAWADDGDGRRLAGFTRPAASGAFTVTIDPHTLATWDDGWSVGRGPWTLEIGVVGDTIRRRPRP